MTEDRGARRPMIHAPLRLPCGVELPNRIAKSAMSERLGTPSGAPSAGLIRLYRRWSAGGAGLLVTGNAMVDRRHTGEPGNVVIEGDADLDALRAWAAAATAGDAHAWVQLNHPGRQAPRIVDAAPVAPSAVPLALAGGQVFAPPRALTDAEIHDVVARFATAARLVREAGFTGVQVHGAHGYLVSQFLSPHTNRRDDGWGGDAERRRRFLVEVVRAIRAEVGPGFPVGVKLNSADFQRGGFSADESMQVVEALEAEGVDLLEISGGTYERAAMFADTSGASTRTSGREAFFLDYAEQVRSRTRLPLMLTGGFRTLAGMSEALSSGAVDVIGMARPLAAEPDLPARLLSGESDAALTVDLSFPVRALSGWVSIAWYQAQLRLMGSGKPPNPGLTRLGALFRYALRGEAKVARPGLGE